MIEAIRWRRRIRPDVRLPGCAERPLSLVAPGGDHYREFIDSGHAVSRLLYEARILRLRHRLHGDQKLVEMNRAQWPFIRLGIVASHREFPRGNERQFGQYVGRHQKRQTG